MDLHNLKKKAAESEKLNKELFRRLKKQLPKDLDEKMLGLHEEVFSYTDCLECANCCKSISPVITDKDIQRIASHLKMRPSEYNSRYLNVDEDGDYVFKETPCLFLMPDNYCKIYSVRPKACKEYPHTDRRRFHQIFDLTIKNSYVCPAVLDILEMLRK
jgi:Fe-S-cluster containining protein